MTPAALCFHLGVNGLCHMFPHCHELSCATMPSLPCGLKPSKTVSQNIFPPASCFCPLSCHREMKVYINEVTEDIVQSQSLILHVTFRTLL